MKNEPTIQLIGDSILWLMNQVQNELEVGSPESEKAEKQLETMTEILDVQMSKFVEESVANKNLRI